MTVLDTPDSRNSAPTRTNAVPVVLPERPAGRHAGWAVLTTMLGRDAWVLRGQLGPLALRAVLQPLAFTFGFAYVLPSIGWGAAGHGTGGSYSTVLVPGLVAITIAVQGISAVLSPLLMEMTYTQQIEDRALVPAPLWVLGVQKILSGAVQALVCGLVVFPVVLLVHAPGNRPHVHVADWPLLVVVLVLASLVAGCLGLLLGTVFEAVKVQYLFAAVVTPLTMLGCVYFPWSSLSVVPWLQWLTLLNPVVYMGEGLRAALTPQVPHLPVPVVLAVQVGLVAVLGFAACRSFVRRISR
ncbi:ABC transporter permease [Kineococcus sp. NPDC059986]|jgi:ABC-2 type transport system permease protein|uniref:ABC transporter permease n=1 Tax=Kineococcus sp. NPDC059986 TaxID=3155538 RepID=UPI00344D378C